MAIESIYAPAMTMASQLAEQQDRLGRLRMAQQQDKEERPVRQALGQNAQALTQAKLYGSPFEQQQFAQKMALEKQNQDRQYALLNNTLRHQQVTEGNQSANLNRANVLAQLKIAQENWKQGMENYNAGLGPHPGPMPGLPDMAAQLSGGQRPQQTAQAQQPAQTGQTSQFQDVSALIPDLKTLPPGERRKLWATRVTELPQATSGLNEALANIDRIQAAAKEIHGSTDLPMATGLTGVVARNIPGTGAKEIDKAIESLKAQVAFSTLNQLRQQSKTGGALGQVSNQEENMLANSLASVDPQQGTDALKRNLTKIIGLTEGAKARLIDAYRRTYGVNPDLSAQKESQQLLNNAMAQEQPQPTSGFTPPPVNNKGWKLHVDKHGNKAYVGPNNEIESVQ